VEERRDDPDIVRLEDYGSFKQRRADIPEDLSWPDSASRMSVRYGRMRGRPSYSSRGRKALGKAVRGFRASARSQARGSMIQRLPATAGNTGPRKPEVKCCDFPYTQAVGTDIFTMTPSTTIVYAGLNYIQEGAGFYNRIGRRIRMKSVFITGNLVASGNATGAGTAEYLRLMLVYDRQPNGNNPGVSDVLADYGQDGNTTTTSYSKTNPNNFERFAILRDERVAIPINGTGGTTQQYNSIVGEQCNKFTWFVKLKDLETHYKSTSTPTTVGDIATGHLFLMTVGNVLAANAGYAFEINARLRFVDL